MSAYIFLCNNLTETECYERQLFGTNNSLFYDKFFSKINIGDFLFLYNFERRILKGPFRALTNCEHNIIYEAWRNKFPYQVRVQSIEPVNGIAQQELKKYINFSYKLPPNITDEQATKLISALQNKSKELITQDLDSKVSNFWVFKCDKTTGGRVFTENLVGAPSNSYPSFVSKVQKGDTIFVWQIEERKLYGIWTAKERGRYDEFAFPEAPGKFKAVVQCDRAFKLEKGLDESILKNQLHVLFPNGNMPENNVNPLTGINIQEELFKINDTSTIAQEKNTIAGKFLTEDGHWVRSQGELIIDNWLYRNNILHAYEHRIQRGSKFKKSDFYLPGPKLIIEYWGMSGNTSYDAQKKDKINFYNENQVHFLELFPQDIQMLSEVLKSKLAGYGINTD